MNVYETELPKNASEPRKRRLTEDLQKRSYKKDNIGHGQTLFGRLLNSP
jgi:hypothetical protein